MFRRPLVAALRLWPRCIKSDVTVVAVMVLWTLRSRLRRGGDVTPNLLKFLLFPLGKKNTVKLHWAKRANNNNSGSSGHLREITLHLTDKFARARSSMSLTRYHVQISATKCPAGSAQLVHYRHISPAASWTLFKDAETVKVEKNNIEVLTYRDDDSSQTPALYFLSPPNYFLPSKDTRGTRSLVTCSGNDQ